ncbi:hypothetical protein [Flavobacterium sp.]|jgi:hypothetical protein|uniref:hypothetical protein n=1 Tax=Flavobacterium sp. TaxID=239 RepID=UPI0025E33F97|nr:hypothetical protein [Flavobacterium sp.]
MKKIAFITMASLLSMTLANCASGKNQLNNLLNQVYIGMPIAEFNKICPKKQVEKMENNITIYRVTKQVWYDSDGSGSDYGFFYFVDGKLVEMNKGERATDYRIKIE